MSHPSDTPPHQPRIRVPAAQYLRMSTEHQQYSSDNQAAAIHRYAEKNGFDIVSAYTDDGKSGLTVEGRRGLLQLGRELINGIPKATGV